jgi:RecQ family ATP-dependent DNA helicase
MATPIATAEISAAANKAVAVATAAAGSDQEARALEVLQRVFGHKTWRPYQYEAIESVLSGRDTLCVMATGAGKTSIFQIPALMTKNTSLVISPNLSLHEDQKLVARSQGITACSLNSLNLEPDAFNDAVNGRVSLVYMSPERALLFLDHIDSMLKRGILGQLVIDEAHLVSQCGASFRPDYKLLKQIRDRFPQLPIVAVTATATTDVVNDIVKLLGMRNTNIICSGFDRHNLTYECIEVLGVKQTEMGVAMRKYLTTDLIRPDETCLFYCNSKNDTELIAAHYQSLGITSAYYNADVSTARRGEVHEAFIKDRIRVIACTTAFGVGVAKPDVRLVVFWGCPTSLEEYSQLIGRAGRDGAPARTIVFYHKSHFNTAGFLVRKDGQPRGELKLEQVKAYLAQTTCRRETLLRYFDETPERLAKYIDPVTKVFKCTGCDCCLGNISERSVSRTPHEPLRAAIKLWRAHEGVRTNMPPYRIFNEETITDLANKRPIDTEHLLSISGFGEYKARMYGPVLIKLIKDYCETHGQAGNADGAPVAAAAAAARAAPRKRERGGGSAAAAAGGAGPAAGPRAASTAVQTLNLHRAGQTIAQISAARQVQAGTVMDHLLQCAEAGQSGDIRVHLLPILPDLDGPVSETLRSNPAATLSQIAATLKHVRPTGNLDPADWLGIKASRLKFYLESGKWAAGAGGGGPAAQRVRA